MPTKKHFKYSFKSALPILLSQIVLTLNNFVSTIMLSHLGHDVLAASALLFVVSTSVVVIFISILFTSSLLISRLYGAQNYSEIGKLIQQSWLLGIFLSLIVMLIYWFIKPILLFCGQKPELVNIIEPYFHYAIFSILPMFINITTKNFCLATNKQHYGLMSSIINVVVALSLGYILIFGKYGASAYGVAGWGIAITIANWISPFFLLILIASNKSLNKFCLFQKHYHKNFTYIKQFFSVGWPMSIQMAAELFAMLVITIMVGLLTKVDLAAIQITMQYMLFLIVPIFGFSNAASVLTGQSYGKKEYTEINKLFFANLMLGVGFLLIVIIAYTTNHKIFINLFLNHHEIDYQKIFQLTYIIFLIRLIGLFFDSIRNITTGALRGLLDTRYPMFIAMFSIWIIYIPLAYILCFVAHYGVIGIASANVAAMAIGASLSLYRWHYKNKTMLRRVTNLF
jgi:MATE family multidrug resistance protein